jgi:glyoxylase-like metal-dependent hydrolase (beta-lactamase superfamily II)
MDYLWGEFLPVPESKLTVLHDGDEVVIGNLCIRAINTPGHANHHFAYALEKTLLSGDIGGVRLTGQDYISVPMPPPEFHLETWRASLASLLKEDMDIIAPTHFGFFQDYKEHLIRLGKDLDQIELWMEKELSGNPEPETVNSTYLGWVNQLYQREGLEKEHITAYEAANPSYMSAIGIQRYWKKYRTMPG